MTTTHDWPCAALRGEPLGPRTTVRIGGRVEWLLEPNHPDEFAAAWREARERGIEPRILGGGANLLIASELLSGVVITTERMSRMFRPNRVEGAAWNAPDPSGPIANVGIAPENDDGANELVVWAGQPMPGLVRAARDLGWTGIEGLVGVPGHLGGGVAMNAGGRWGNMWDVVKSVRLLMPDGELVDRAREDCNPKYRDMNLGDAIVLGAVLHFERGNKVQIRETMRSYLAEKSAAQPVTERSSGCIFRNPDPERSDGRSAGKLVEDCGGKGMRCGDAIVSPKHGNFIVNAGAARGADVMELIERVRELVAEKSGVELEREVKVWSEPAPR